MREAANLGHSSGRRSTGADEDPLEGYGIQKRSMWPFAHFFMYFLYA